MTEQTERRSRMRIDYEAAITLCPQDAPSITGHCANVSMDGLLVKSGSSLAVGTACGVKIILQGPSSSLTIDIEGEVSRCAKGTLAVRFKNNLEWWAIFTIYSQYSGNISVTDSLSCP